ncbi:unnamed protein product [Fraxinus pennsylvanica]|uniref:DUF4378 domain-containing protein n=1 Tax=Fraxinus pennsylvanica TaxID=56036 RepID=A0AAD2DZB6_9LAMI|nr:unnamed protein product [Fraxinus pennsylvanica]
MAKRSQRRLSRHEKEQAEGEGAGKLLHPSSESLDPFIKRDMAKHEKWMYLGSNIVHIGTELGERIFSELIEDTVLSFATDTSEYEFTVLLVEYEAIEDIDL